MSAADDFQMWAELAAGDEHEQFVPLIDVAKDLNVTPNEIVRVAVELKRETGNTTGWARWFGGVPWFSIPVVTLITARVLFDREHANVAAQAAKN